MSESEVAQASMLFMLTEHGDRFLKNVAKQLQKHIQYEVEDTHPIFDVSIMDENGTIRLTAEWQDIRYQPKG